MPRRRGGAERRGDSPQKKTTEIRKGTGKRRHPTRLQKCGARVLRRVQEFTKCALDRMKNVTLLLGVCCHRWNLGLITLMILGAFLAVALAVLGVASANYSRRRTSSSRVSLLEGTAPDSEGGELAMHQQQQLGDVEWKALLTAVFTLPSTMMKSVPFPMPMPSWLSPVWVRFLTSPAIHLCMIPVLVHVAWRYLWSYPPLNWVTSLFFSNSDFWGIENPDFNYNGAVDINAEPDPAMPQLEGSGDMNGSSGGGGGGGGDGGGKSGSGKRKKMKKKSARNRRRENRPTNDQDGGEVEGETESQPAGTSTSAPGKNKCSGGKSGRHREGEEEDNGEEEEEGKDEGAAASQYPPEWLVYDKTYGLIPKEVKERWDYLDRQKRRQQKKDNSSGGGSRRRRKMVYATPVTPTGDDDDDDSDWFGIDE